MTPLEELAARLPQELRVRPEDMPPGLAEGFEYLAHLTDLQNGGVPAGELPSIEEWRQARAH